LRVPARLRNLMMKQERISNGAARPPIMWFALKAQLHSLHLVWAADIACWARVALRPRCCIRSLGFATSRHCPLALFVWGQRLYNDASLLRTCPRIVNNSSSLSFPSASTSVVIGRPFRARLLPYLRCDLSCEPGIPFDSDRAHCLPSSPMLSSSASRELP